MSDQPPNPVSPPTKSYTLKFEPIGAFTADELFVKGFLKGKFWISDTIVARFRSMTGEDVDKINEAVKVSASTTVAHYNTEITYRNLAHSLEAINDTVFSGDVEDRVKKVRSMPSALLGRLSLAYLEFNDRIDSLFIGKEAEGVAKKS